MNARRICVVTGTRAEYGLLRRLLADLAARPGIQLQLVVTGMHLAPEYGLTHREIEADGFRIDRKLEILLASDSRVGMAKSTGLAMLAFADALAELAPDIVVVLGDRFEVFAAASTALLLRMPIAHIHGGELTQGAVDDALRHAVSKMASLHFAATADSRRRLLQLGEAEDRVFAVGGLGVDAVRHLPRLGRVELEAALGLPLAQRNLLVTFHPATAEDGDPAGQCEALLAALDGFPDARVIITLPNADAGGRAVAARLLAYAGAHPDRVTAHASLGMVRYLSCLALVDGVIGNSSSGLLEAPSLGVGTVNIGSRQAGRPRATSVIDCAPTQDAIRAAIEHLFSADFRAGLGAVANPYGDGGASERIATILAETPLAALTAKSFVDRPLGTDSEMN